MKKITIDEKEFELIEDYKDAFDKDEFTTRYTEYFDIYDYILGDWSYGKLRLKGFCEKNSKALNKINDFENVKTYIKDNCAYDCKYFILKKLN